MRELFVTELKAQQKQITVEKKKNSAQWNKKEMVGNLRELNFDDIGMLNICYWQLAHRPERTKGE